MTTSAATTAPSTIEQPSPRDSRSCIGCEQNQWTPLYESLVKCDKCGLIRAADFPLDDELRELYSDAYFNGSEYGDYLADRICHERNFDRRLRMMRAITRVDRVLEIGCAHGLWVKFLNDHGVAASGIDISTSAVTYAVDELGVNAVPGDFMDIPIAANEYSVMCLWDTIEHLAHPEAYLDKIARALPVGGWLFLTTGDIGSLMARVRGARWRMIHPPTHLYYFSRTTLAGTLRRFNLEPRLICTEAVYRTIGSTLRGLIGVRGGLPGRMASLALNTIPSAIAERVGGPVNLGDIMFVGAQKKSDV